jgi:hypothetical protein
VAALAVAIWAASACQLFVDVGGLSNGQCPAGHKLCDGQCRSKSDPKYGCNNPNSCVPCVFVNEYGMCDKTTSECVPAPSGCIGNYRICSTDPLAGCTVDVSHDPANCGGCGQSCPMHANISLLGCSGGVCAVGSCTRPYEDCNHVFDDGCETDLQNDPANCGACGVGCQAGQSCVGGVCQSSDASVD